MIRPWWWFDWHSQNICRAKALSPSTSLSSLLNYSVSHFMPWRLCCSLTHISRIYRHKQTEGHLAILSRRSHAISVYFIMHLPHRDDELRALMSCNFSLNKMVRRVAVSVFLDEYATHRRRLPTAAIIKRPRERDDIIMSLRCSSYYASKALTYHTSSYAKIYAPAPFYFLAYTVA